MAISWKGDAALSFGANSITPTMPTHAAGDMLLAIWTGKPFDGSVSVTGWTALSSGASGTTAAGIDVGSMKAQVWWKEAASASETAPTFTEGATVWNIAGGGVSVWQKGASEAWDAPVVVYGADEDLGANFSATMASDPGITAADGIQMFSGANSDGSGPLTAGPTITATSAVFGTVTKDRDQETTAGGDMAMTTSHCLVSSGTATAAAVLGGTVADSGSPRWEVGLVRLRVSTPVVLVIQDTASASLADNLALTQHNILAVADTASASSADNLVLTQHNVLAVADTTSAALIDNLTLVAHNGTTLIIQDAADASLIDNVVLTQHNVLAVQDTASASLADNLVLTQHNHLTVQDATSASTADNITLVQHHVLVVQDATSGSTIDNVVLSIPDEGGEVLSGQRGGSAYYSRS